jgi:ABC-type transport system involved in multi-copper enzyme maturation permease subunit
MTTTIQRTRARQRITTQRANPLLSVMAWELRRLRASRSTWILPPIALGLFLLILWNEREPIDWGPVSVFDHTTLRFTFGGSIVSLSAWGLTFILPSGLLFLLAIILPFVSADGVNLDLKRRTHELLMTTAIPAWAYVFGRYLVVIGLSLGLAVLQVAAILGMGLALHLSLGGPDNPAPQVGSILALWAAMILPAMLLISSSSFALGTLLPRQTNLVKVGLIVIWLIGALIIPTTPIWQNIHLPAWYEDWDPTSALLWRAFHYDRAFTQASLQLAPHPTGSQLSQLFQSVEYQQPDLWAWLGPHLLWAALALALVAFAAVTFRRFRTVQN